MYEPTKNKRGIKLTRKSKPESKKASAKGKALSRHVSMAWGKVQGREGFPLPCVRWKKTEEGTQYSNTSTHHTIVIRMNTATQSSTHQHINTHLHNYQHQHITQSSTHQHINTSTHQHSHQHINHQHSRLQHFNTSTHQHINTSR